MSEDRTIRGETTLTWADQARLSIRPLAKQMGIFIVLTIVISPIGWIIASSDTEWLLLRHHPLDVLGDFTEEVWPILLTGYLVMLILMMSFYARAFARFPDPNRRLSYEATRDGITTRDAANFALVVPWSSVIRMRKDEHTMRIQLATRGWRTIFLRAFAAEDREQILRWAQQNANAPGSPKAT